jgi:anti-sigma B factor antagonist
MNYEFEQREKVLLVKIDGRLVAAYAEEFQNQVLDHMETCKSIVIDLSKMTHIDSSGLGSLVFLLQRANAIGGNVKLACLQSRPRIIFEITRVFRVFEIFDTVDAAVKSYEE